MTREMTAWMAQGGRTLADEDAFVAVRRPVPEPRPRDVLVEVHAVSVNPVDTKVRAGLPAGQTRQLGWDAAGTVVAVGDEVAGFAVGDEVWYAGDITRDGSNAQLHAVDERIVSRKPTSLTWAEAAAMPLTAITAWESLFDRLALTADTRGTLLVHGASGGVGSLVVQLAKALTKATVVASAGREESRAWVLSQGADHAVDRRHLVRDVHAVAPQGIDWAFTPFSKDSISAFAELLQPFGHVVAIDDPPDLDTLPLKRKSIALHWELMFTRSMFETADLSEQGRLLSDIAELVDDGAIRSTLTTAVPGLDPPGLRRAHELVAGGHTVGKVVVHH